LQLNKTKDVLTQITEIIHDVIRPEAVSVDQTGHWPERGLRALQAAGLGGLVIPSSLGGLGFGLLTLAQVCEAIGESCASTALCFGMHCVGSSVLAAKVTPDQQERYLAPINAGKHLTTLALSEMGTGIHFYLPEARLTRVDHDLYHLNGVKTFVTNGGYADSYVISTAASDANAPADTFSCVVIKKEAPGLIWGEPWDGIGMRGNASRSLTLESVPISRHDLLGEEGDEIWYVFHVIAPYFLTAMAGTYLGIATVALEEGRTHLMKRHYSHTGSPLGQNSVLQHRLGMLWSQVERTRQLIYYAASEYDNGGSRALPAVMSAKAEAAHCAVDVVNEVMTLAGGRSYQGESQLYRHLRDARAAHVMSPTTDILYTWLGRYLLDLPLLGD
jgi:alkylation response protein AidB-like acyl-CoA dehydrogenase